MATPSLPPSVLDSLIQALGNVNASRYVCASGVVMMFYDWLLTLPTEVDTVWRSRKTSVSYIYFINRYLPFPLMLLFNYHIAGFRPAVSDTLYVLTLHASVTFSYGFCHSCKGEMLTAVIASDSMLAVSSWLLSLRVVSLWSQQKLVVYSIYAAYIAVQVTAWTVGFIWFYYESPSISYDTTVQLCGTKSLNIISGGYFVSICFELYIFTLQVIHHYMRTRLARQLDMPTTTLLRTLYHDGYVYFTVIVSVRILTAAAWLTQPISLWYMFIQLAYAMTSALTCRFYLHLRSAASPSNLSTYRTTTILSSPRDYELQPPRDRTKYQF